MFGEEKPCLSDFSHIATYKDLQCKEEEAKSVYIFNDTKKVEEKK